MIADSSATALPAGTVKKNPNDGLDYVWIPPGRFEMGCVPGHNLCKNDEKPRHTVTITKGFWMGQTEVTVGAYRRFVNATRGRMPNEPDFNPGWRNEQQPIVKVDWDPARAYCEWAGGELPTEAEWEYAARGGKEGLIYPNGNELTRQDARFSGAGWGPTVVGQFPSNGYGLHDMAGNAWEWVADGYEASYYNASPERDPTGPGSGGLRVLRGGSWYDDPVGLRASDRSGGQPGGERRSDIGFRCAREVSP